MTFSLRQIQYFIAVAESGTISGAASRLSTSQSTITEAIKDLEADLGVKLIERHARGIHVTHKGQLFLRHAERIWSDVADARRALAADFPVTSGRLVIGVTSLVAGYVLPEVLARFRRAFPAIAIQVVEDTQDYLEHLLLNGEIDVALVIVSSLSDPEALSTQVLDEYAYRVWLPQGHTLATGRPVPLAALAEHPQIALTTDEIQGTTDRLWRTARLRPDIVFRTGSVEAVRSLVGAGIGVTVLPDLIFRAWSHEGQRLEAHEIEADLPKIKAAVVWRRGSNIAVPTRRFLDVTLAQRLSRGR